MVYLVTVLKDTVFSFGMSCVLSLPVTVIWTASPRTKGFGEHFETNMLWSEMGRQREATLFPELASQWIKSHMPTYQNNVHHTLKYTLPTTGYFSDPGQIPHWLMASVCTGSCFIPIQCDSTDWGWKPVVSMSWTCHSDGGIVLHNLLPPPQPILLERKFRDDWFPWNKGPKQTSKAQCGSWQENPQHLEGWRQRRQKKLKIVLSHSASSRQAWASWKAGRGLRSAALLLLKTSDLAQFAAAAAALRKTKQNRELLFL